jgi:hypothetical protein
MAKTAADKSSAREILSTLGQRTRHGIQRLGPYQSLLVLIVPVAVVEPLKLAAVAIAGSGHWYTGAAVIGAAYLASIVGIHRLFLIVKPKLLKFRWFAKGWQYFTGIRQKALATFHK